MSNCELCLSNWGENIFVYRCPLCMIEVLSDDDYPDHIPALIEAFRAGILKEKKTEAKLKDLEAKLKASEAKLQASEANLKASEAKLSAHYAFAFTEDN